MVTLPFPSAANHMLKVLTGVYATHPPELPAVCMHVSLRRAGLNVYSLPACTVGAVTGAGS